MHAHISDSVMFILTMVYFCQVLCLSLSLNTLYPVYYCILFLFVFFSITRCRSLPVFVLYCLQCDFFCNINCLNLSF